MPGGRPRKNIDQKQFENLCGLQCTQEDICGFFDICSDTLNTWCKRTYKMGFSEVYAQKRGSGRISLRRIQFRLAQKNAAMAIFLGKNMLGQTDKVVHVNADKDRQELRELFEDVKNHAEPETDEIPE